MRKSWLHDLKALLDANQVVWGRAREGRYLLALAIPHLRIALELRPCGDPRCKGRARVGDASSEKAKYLRRRGWVVQYVCPYAMKAHPELIMANLEEHVEAREAYRRAVLREASLLLTTGAAYWQSSRWTAV